MILCRLLEGDSRVLLLDWKGGRTTRSTAQVGGAAL